MAGKGKRKRRGTIGIEIFEQVERMVAEQNVKRTAAFRRLSEKSGRSAATVAANYYRIARQRGAKLRKRTLRGPGLRPGVRGLMTSQRTGLDTARGIW